MQTVLITGANSGIGKSLAILLAKRQVKVLLACRSFTKTKPVTITKTKTTIPKTLKTSIWNMYVGTKHRTAYCICCNDKKIAVENFHAGHIISEHNNGKTNTDNLLPICSQCNLSMGKTNMNEFIEKTYPNNMKIFNSRKCRIPNTGFIKNIR